MNQWEEVGAALAREVKTVLNSRCAAIEARLSRIESALEAIGDMRYCGIWEDDRDYKRGNFVTAAGSYWHAEETTRSRPGSDSTWRLAFKKGTFT